MLEGSDTSRRVPFTKKLRSVGMPLARMQIGSRSFLVNNLGKVELITPSFFNHRETVISVSPPIGKSPKLIRPSTPSVRTAPNPPVLPNAPLHVVPPISVP